MNSHDRKPSSDCHCTRQVGSNANEPVRLHEEIEKEALMEMLKQIVQTPTDTLNCSAEGHLILPPLANRRKSDGIDMIGHEDAMWTCRVSNRLRRHPSDQCE